MLQFIKEDSGAVTVDWVVLTAGLVGLGLATMAVVSAGVRDTAEDIEDQLTQDGIIRTAFPGLDVASAVSVLGQLNVDNHMAAAAGYTDEVLTTVLTDKHDILTDAGLDYADYVSSYGTPDAQLDGYTESEYNVFANGPAEAQETYNIYEDESNQRGL